MASYSSVSVLRHSSVYLATVTTFLGVFLLVPALIFWARNLGADPFVIGLIIGAYSWTKMGGTLVWGGVADRYGRRPPLIIGSSVVAVTLVMMTFAQEPWHLLVIQLFRGFFGGAAAPIMPILAADLAPRKMLGGIMGIYVFMLNLALTIGAPVSGFLYDVTAAWPFLAAAAMELITVLLVVFLVPETLKKTVASKTRNQPATLHSFQARVHVWVDLMKRRGLLLANFWEFCRRLGKMAVGSVAFTLFAEQVGLSATMIGTLGGISGIVRMVGYIPFGLLSDRIGRKWQFILSPLIQGAALALYPIFPSFSGFAGIRVIEATGSTIGAGPARALLMDWTTRAERGKAQGLNKFAESVGSSIGDPLVGWITESYGFSSAFFYGAAIMITSSLAVSLAWQDPRQSKRIGM